jgi:hypothetical protein
MRNFILGFIIAGLLFGTVVVASGKLDAVKATFEVLVNGEKFDGEAVVIEGRTFLPLRAIGDALKVPVSWNVELKRVEVGKVKQQALTDIIVSDGLEIKPIARKELGGHYAIVVKVSNTSKEDALLEWQRLTITTQRSFPVEVNTTFETVNRDLLIEAGETKELVFTYKPHEADFLASAVMSYKGERIALNYRKLPVI